MMKEVDLRLWKREILSVNCPKMSVRCSTNMVYFIALGDFAHVVVGSCEMAYIVMAHGANFFDYFFRFLIPCGVGNIIGGTLIFTLLVYYQVAKELQSGKKKSYKQSYNPPKPWQ